MSVSGNPFKLENGGGQATATPPAAQPAEQPAAQPAAQPGNAAPTNPFSLDAGEQSVMNSQTPQPGGNMQQGATFSAPNPNNPAPQGFGQQPAQNTEFNPTPPANNPAPQGFGQQPAQNTGFNPAPAQNNNFNPAPQNTGFNGQAGQNNQQMKYSIIDFYWWINQKIIAQQQLGQGETSILTLGFNASFNNLRMTFYNANDQTFSPSSITIGNAQKITTCNLFSEQALQLLAKKGTGEAVYAFERVIKAGQNWTPNQTQIAWNADNIVIQTQDSQNRVSSFTLVQEQIIGFEKSLEFLINGNSWVVALQAAIAR